MADPGRSPVTVPPARDHRRRRCHRAHATRAPDTVVLLGAPGSRRPWATTCPTWRRLAGRVVCVDPWWQWTDPLRVVSEFHHVAGTSGSTPPRESAVPTDPRGCSTWRSYEAVAQAVIERELSGD